MEFDKNLEDQRHDWKKVVETKMYLPFSIYIFISYASASRTSASSFEFGACSRMGGGRTCKPNLTLPKRWLQQRTPVWRLRLLLCCYVTHLATSAECCQHVCDILVQFYYCLTALKPGQLFHLVLCLTSFCDIKHLLCALCQMLDHLLIKLHLLNDRQSHIISLRLL